MRKIDGDKLEFYIEKRLASIESRMYSPDSNLEIKAIAYAQTCELETIKILIEKGEFDVKGD